MTTTSPQDWLLGTGVEGKTLSQYRVDLPHLSPDLVIPDPCRQTKLNTNLSVKYNLWCLSWSRSLTTKVPDPSKYICGRGETALVPRPCLSSSSWGGSGWAGGYGWLALSTHLTSSQEPSGRLRKMFPKTILLVWCYYCTVCFFVRDPGNDKARTQDLHHPINNVHISVSGASTLA